ncbi:DUF3883 domain-containing protein [Clostridium tagluense]|uniref:DUF3883 domain-containing protein n=1 Tax=Clostridium tagluense TaxID=360422 RepID=UPI001CF48716|nr:DUF3883 domain-containing protein [Clostridium tagluense]MCB2312328.1 DUF3883 domain-containing protein [Clostridium tagluense]MCB2316934.1 DUF3883 domain-containing protein [Clostridium tagluense]MCB2321867.1 DUF3883 domain-containing protein [Clostridium tagluense]MCB2326713.1 DUF3883 domain-containing protein [Clostridium tagluense]MCB2331526.1 DUF3883 domain-containing protein [Clostridium tagluense]
MSFYTETEIMEVAIKVIEEYGELNTTELKEILNDIMEPNGEDLIINKNRNDSKFDQKVRNMISHRDTNDLYKYFDYRADKRVGILTSKSIKKTEIIEQTEAIAETGPKYSLKDESPTRKEKKKSFNARKVDFEEINKRNRELGAMGEIFVLQFEIGRLGKEIGDKVRHVSEDDGDGAGYDILSYNEAGEIRFLEVKTTTGSLETPFFLSENERLFLETFGDEAEIVRVYNFNKELKEGKIHRISGLDFFKVINLQAIGYKASFKNDDK